jgi:hypothetical protein
MTTSPFVDSLFGGLLYSCCLMQLGDGTLTGSLSPPTVDVLTGVRAIATGNEYTCAIAVAGGLKCWGYNVNGQVRFSASVPIAALMCITNDPRQVVVQVSVFYAHA